MQAAWAVRMFKCDTARIIETGDMLFLVIGHKKNTCQDSGVQWLKNGELFDFEYVAESCIASGKTLAELKKSAREYKRISNMTMQQFLKHIVSGDGLRQESKIGR